MDWHGGWVRSRGFGSGWVRLGKGLEGEKRWQGRVCDDGTTMMVGVGVQAQGRRRRWLSCAADVFLDLSRVFERGLRGGEALAPRTMGGISISCHAGDTKRRSREQDGWAAWGPNEGQGLVGQQAIGWKRRMQRRRTRRDELRMAWFGSACLDYVFV
ncbi:hypothetical protein BC567DRAFT_220669 [Phyllosticta citribraziliensis]